MTTHRGALAPGADTTVTLNKTSPVGTIWRMYVRANADTAVAECRRYANNLAGPVVLEWLPDSVLVRGRFTYRDTGYVRDGAPVGAGSFAVHPLRGARVAIMDRNTQSADRLLGTTCTDEDGSFALALASRYDPEVGTVDEPHLIDVYARALLNADELCACIPAVTVKHWSDTTTWSFDGPVRMDVSGTLVDFGEISPPLGPSSYGIRSAMHIYETILSAAQRMRGYGFEPVKYPVQRGWQTFVRWEPGGGGLEDYNVSVSKADTIWVAGERFYRQNPLTPDEWDDCLLLHEYGHQVAHKGGFVYSPPAGVECAPHSFGKPAECPVGAPSPGYAWNEGWADFLGALLGAVGPGSLYLDVGYDAEDSLYVLQVDLETGERYEGRAFRPPMPNMGHAGPTYEAANAGALWDWVDLAQDNEDPHLCFDRFSEGFEHLVGTLLADRALGLDSLVNLYMAYQHRRVGGDLQRARALFEVLCDHGFWKEGSEQDTVGYVGVEAGRGRPPYLSLSPSPTLGRVVFSIAAQPSPQAPLLEVFDIAGRVLWRTTASGAGDGIWRAAWDGRMNTMERVRPGVYFVRCRVSGVSLRHAFVIMR